MTIEFKQSLSIKGKINITSVKTPIQPIYEWELELVVIQNF